MLGFKAGVALHLRQTQATEALRVCREVTATSGNAWRSFSGNWARPIALAPRRNRRARLLVLGKKLLPNQTVALFVVVGGILAASWLGLGALGVNSSGRCRAGDPVPSLPAVSHADVRELVPLALACFLLGAVDVRGDREDVRGRSTATGSTRSRNMLALSGPTLASGF